MHMLIIEFHAVIFSPVLCSFGQSFHALVAYHLENCGMPLHDEVRINCKNCATTRIKEQEYSIWAQGCMFDNCACIF